MASKLQPDDLRVVVFLQFRNYALLWIVVFIVFYWGAHFIPGYVGLTLASSSPDLLLISVCILLAAIWHAAAVITLNCKKALEHDVIPN